MLGVPHGKLSKDKSARFLTKTQQLSSIANLNFVNGLEAAIHLMKIPSENRTAQENSYIGLYIQRLEYFKNLLAKYGQASYDHVCRDIQARTYQKGEAVFHQGDKGEEFYIVVSGSVGVYIQKISDDPNDTTSFIPREINILKPGDSFGELALIKGKNGTRNASIYAKERTDLAFFTANVFNKLLLEKEKDRFDLNLKFLCDVEVFKESEEEVPRNVFMYSKLKNVVNNQIIYDIDDPSDLFFIVKEGNYLVQKPACIGGKNVLVKICSLHQGEIFGHEDIIYDQPRQCQVKCVSCTGELFVMTKQDFLSRLWNVSETLVTRLTVLTKQRITQSSKRIKQADNFAHLVIQQDSPTPRLKSMKPKVYNRSYEHFKQQSKDEDPAPNGSTFLTERIKTNPSTWMKNLVQKSYTSQIKQPDESISKVKMISGGIDSSISEYQNYNTSMQNSPRMLASKSDHFKKNFSEFDRTITLPSQYQRQVREMQSLTQRLDRFKQVDAIRQAMRNPQNGTHYRAFFQYELDFDQLKTNRQRYAY